MESRAHTCIAVIKMIPAQSEKRKKGKGAKGEGGLDTTAKAKPQG